MATNCYDLESRVTVCVDGPVGSGNMATLSVMVSSSDFDAPSPIGIRNNWDGSAESFTGWASNFTGGCDVTSSTLTVTLVGTNEVEVAIEIQVENCDSGQNVYSACGDTGPHTFTDTRIVTMTGAPCIA